MVDQKFIEDLQHALRHAKTICQVIFHQEKLDSIGIVEDDDGLSSKVEYAYSRGGGYHYYDNYTLEFPIKYLTMTIKEIADEEERLKEEERLEDLEREAARKPKEIEDREVEGIKMKNVQDLVGKTIKESKLGLALSLVFTDGTKILVENDGFRCAVEVKTQIEEEVTEVRTRVVTLERK